ncbi:MAG TPA: MscL family protein [Candidatus Saccharimonadales bacterium]|nr:MscL family protein [Candidatus Saccharimonadales bacterium]
MSKTTTAKPVVKVASEPALKGKVPVTARLKNGRTVTVLMDADDAVREQVGGFVNFVREHAIVGLAIGFIIGAQAQAVIKQLVDSFITPALSVLLGGSLAKKTFMLGGEEFKWGAMVYALVNLISVLVAIYLLLKIFKLDKLDKPKDKAAPEEPKTKKQTRKTKAKK